MSILRNISKTALLFIGSTSAIAAGMCMQDYKNTSDKKSLVAGFGLSAISGLCIGGAAIMDRKDTIEKTLNEVNNQLSRNEVK